jgi:hypothetical protein
MAVNRAELEKVLEEKARQDATRFEEEIDKALREKWYAWGSVTVSLHATPSEAIKQNLIHRYRNNGWDLKFRQSQQYNDILDCVEVTTYVEPTSVFYDR